MITAVSEVKVEFYDVDAMKVVWHGHYARFMEVGRMALYDKLGYGYMEMEASGYSWPVVDLHIRYVRPARLGQVLRVSATLTEWENRVRMEFLITDAATGEKITKGDCTQVAVDNKTGELEFVCPEVFQSKVRSLLP
jgi:acyl-CoA thioester hydrolase